LHFFSYSGEGFFILYKESEENREIQNVRLVGTDDSSILLKTIFYDYDRSYCKKLPTKFIKSSELSRVKRTN